MVRQQELQEQQLRDAALRPKKGKRKARRRRKKVLPAELEEVAHLMAAAAQASAEATEAASEAVGNASVHWQFGDEPGPLLPTDSDDGSDGSGSDAGSDAGEESGSDDGVMEDGSSGNMRSRRALPMLRLPGESPLSAEVLLELPHGVHGEEAKVVVGQMPSVEEGYQRIRLSAAVQMNELAVAAFKATAAGERELPVLPSNLAGAGPSVSRGYRLTLDYAAQLRVKMCQQRTPVELGELQAKVEWRASQYGMHSQQLCLQFEHKCLGAPASVGGSSSSGGGSGGSGEGLATGVEAHIYLRAYLRLLFELFPTLMHSPVVLPTTALELEEGTALELSVRRMRDLCKRFLVYQHPDSQAEAMAAARALVRAGVEPGVETQAMRAAKEEQAAEGAGAASAPPPKRSRLSGRRAGLSGAAGKARAPGTPEAAAAPPRAAAQPTASRDKFGCWSVSVPPLAQGGRVRPVGTPLDLGLHSISTRILGHLHGNAQAKYSSVSAAGVLAPGNLSCTLQYGRYSGGRVFKDEPRNSWLVLKAVKAAQEPGYKLGSLYLTDASMPVVKEGFPEDAPGTCCDIDEDMAGVVPHALSTQRGSSATNFLKIESTGVACTSGYASLADRPVVTSMHRETLLLPSINIGSGDLIVQLLTNPNNVRLMQRQHTAVVGEYERHTALAALHLYPLGGNALVVHMRDEGFASIVEFPQGSCHGVITFGSIATTYPPTVKAACNDLEMWSQFPATYFTGLLATFYTGLIPEEGHSFDKAHSWTQSPYITRHPCTWQRHQARLASATFPPWQDECDGGSKEVGGGGEKAAAGADAAEDAAEDAEEEAVPDCSSDMMVVRMVEKALDVVHGRIVEGASWSRELPTPRQCLEALADMLPLLRHLAKRAEEEKVGESGRQFLRRLPAGAAPISRQYLDRLLERVCALGPQGLDEQLATGCYAGALPLPALPVGEQVTRAVLSAGVFDHYLQASGKLRKMMAVAADRMEEGPLLARGPHVLRGHWLLACHREWELLRRTPQDRPHFWARLEQLRLRRSQMEELCGRASDALAAQVAAALAQG